MHPMVGKELGNYVVRSLLGEGGMGAVFAGEHRFLGDKVAIKVLHGSFANNENVTQRFFQEAKSSREIKHPGIITIIDFGQTADGALYLVMELLEGKSLAQALVESGPLPEDATRGIGGHVADALAAAHAKGIVHRDLKPDNLFLVGEIVKVLDFGIAKVLTSAAGTKTGSLLGTPMFMAPEQAKAAKVIGPGVDIYALGAILYNMIAGRPPFEGDLPQLLAAHLFEKPVPPSERGVMISTDLEALIMQCLEKEPDARPQKMTDIRDRLTGTEGKKYTEMIKAVSSSQPGTQQRPVVTKSQAGNQSLAHQSTLSGAAAEVADAPAPAKKGPAKFLIPAAAAAVVVIGGAIAMTRKSPPPPPPPVAAAPAPAPRPLPPVPPSVPKIHIKLKLDPPDARVELDGIATSDNPLELPQSETTHQIVVSAPGKQTVTRDVRAMTSGEIYVQLQAPVAAAPPAHHSSGHAAKPAAPPKSKVRGPVETDL